MSLEHPGVGHLTVPMLKPLPVGTLSAILKEAAAQLGLAYTDVLDQVF